MRAQASEQAITTKTKSIPQPYWILGKSTWAATHVPRSSSLKSREKNTEEPFYKKFQFSAPPQIEST